MSTPADLILLLEDAMAAAITAALDVAIVRCRVPEDLFALHPCAVVLDARLVSDDDLVRLCEAYSCIVLAPTPRLEELADTLPEKTDVLHAQSPPALVVRAAKRKLQSHRGALDPLTQVLSRTAFWPALQAKESAAGPHVLMIFDIDRFKRFNDDHGHQTGDEILAAVAARLQQLAPANAIVSRVGGEEFGIYANVGDGAALADALRIGIREVPCAGHSIKVSGGVVTSSDSFTATELMRRADEALYSAKARGRDCVVSYRELTLEARARDRDVSLEAFESRTKVIAERVAEAISARGRQLFNKLQQRADVDVVTGLYSRGYLDRRLAFELDQATRESTPMTVALVDLDHFGEVNKTYGWPTGDEALRVVSDALSAAVRSTDWVARYGGEELCVVMFGAGLDVARGVLERLVDAVAALTINAADGTEFAVTVSIGAATASGTEAVEALIERASTRLLEAKRAGRNRLAV